MQNYNKKDSHLFYMKNFKNLFLFYAFLSFSCRRRRRCYFFFFGQKRKHYETRKEKKREKKKVVDQVNYVNKVKSSCS